MLFGKVKSGKNAPTSMTAHTGKCKSSARRDLVGITKSREALGQLTEPITEQPQCTTGNCKCRKSPGISPSRFAESAAVP